MFNRIRFNISKYTYLNRLKTQNCNIHKSIIFRDIDYCKIGNQVCLGEGCRLLCWSSYTSGKVPQSLTPEIVIGDRVHATRFLTIQCAGQVTIEEDVLIASNVFIVDFNHGTDPITDNYLDNPLDVSSVIIRKGCWIGNDVKIMPGVEIGEKSIIGAGSVVTKSIPSYSIAVGNPARVIKKYDHETNKWTRV